jgi:PAS domain S-box-containing protein
LLEQAADGILVANTAGVLVEANAAMCRLLGYTADELLGKRIMEVASLGIAI